MVPGALSVMTPLLKLLPMSSVDNLATKEVRLQYLNYV